MPLDQHRTSTIRVLLVDDDPGFTDVLRRRLTRRGLSVHTAADGGEAFAMVEAGHFHVVVLDVGLPDVDGMQLLKAIKRRSGSIEVIVLTGGHTGPLESLRAGAFDLFPQARRGGRAGRTNHGRRAGRGRSKARNRVTENDMWIFLSALQVALELRRTCRRCGARRVVAPRLRDHAVACPRCGGKMPAPPRR